MNILIGYTGFVGSSLNSQMHFDRVFNSKNIKEAFGLEPDLCVYAGVRAEKFIANLNPEDDFDQIDLAIDQIKLIKPKKLILISTVDVYSSVVNVDEETEISKNSLHAYGRNRLYLEEWVENNLEDFIIIRLPALFGDGLKKNFIFDLINRIPTMIKTESFFNLRKENPEIDNYYKDMGNGFHKVIDLSSSERINLRKALQEMNIDSINFTNPKSIYQFYNLDSLSQHIFKILDLNIKKVNLVTEPICVSEIYESVTNEKFDNDVNIEPAIYDIKTVYSDIFGYDNGYVDTKENVLLSIKDFVEARL